MLADSLTKKFNGLKMTKFTDQIFGLRWNVRILNFILYVLN